MRPTIAQVNLSYLSHNLRQIRKHLPAAIDMTAVVKADAYGHGAIPVSKRALFEGATSLAVATVQEGIELREAGIKVPILILGLTFPEEAKDIIRYDLTVAACTKEQIDLLATTARAKSQQARIMLKVDTGMSRIGFLPQDLLEFVDYTASLPNANLRGCFTHLATADSADKEYAGRQIGAFKNALQTLEAKRIQLPYISFANSASIMDLDCTICTHARPGIILYGLEPSKEMQQHLNLKPVMSLKTKVAYVKQIPAGTTVGYGRTFTADEDVYVATLPIGYADGYHRLLSNKAPILIGGKRRQLIGNICMDQIMVNLGNDPTVQAGDEAVLFGQQGKEEITLGELADIAQTIHYELACAVSKRVPRHYID
ncbi:MAG: alanine racemase [Sporomusaceae bacterium]|nr:alanine racemase [Sporomusaceae bacterium]